MQSSIVVTNYGGRLGVLLGNGDGTFQPVRAFGPTDNYLCVTVADVNGDTIPDIVAATGASSTVVVFPGNGDGTFQSEATYSSGGYLAMEVVVTDVNADGRPDLVVVNACISTGDCTNGTASVLLNGGGGAFQPATAFDSGGFYANSIAVADVDLDGRPDLLVGNTCIANNSSCYNFTPGLPSTVAVLLGNGDGTFQPGVAYPTGPYYTLSVEVADVNGDSKPDLVVAKGGSSTVGVLLGNGDGTFQPLVAYGSGGYYAIAVAVTDVNGDGKPDLIAANCSFKSRDGCNEGERAAVAVLLGNGDGTFQSARSYASGGVGEVNSLAVADLNGDGKPDLAAANICVKKKDCSTGSIGILLNKTHQEDKQQQVGLLHWRSS